MNRFLPALLFAFLTASSYAADKTGFGHYLLVHPSSTIETDFSGKCVRVSNISQGVVYLPLASQRVFADALKAFRGVLKIDECQGT